MFKHLKATLSEAVPSPAYRCPPSHRRNRFNICNFLLPIPACVCCQLRNTGSLLEIPAACCCMLICAEKQSLEVIRGATLCSPHNHLAWQVREGVREVGSKVRQEIDNRQILRPSSSEIHK